MSLVVDTVMTGRFIGGFFVGVAFMLFLAIILDLREARKIGKTMRVHETEAKQVPQRHRNDAREF